ncbi:hypothetical protein AKJ57_03975 [candidate division MSBL1 archaeon SCGC-AAA259A05]|uniref:Glycosyltransferase subfamily 4-like N-terminal domain-containing protein n=1 Tax=candidate division MSBL1 archaeon SCGC-AAA259A05 TaxID=1698259 RepID=A0A133U937_9EURY|nr:hypothetical protein AKJ57_03975 [candidate division MSBL1 archaeon SCGC-AAA259A05]
MKICLLYLPDSLHLKRWLEDYVDLGHEVHVIGHYAESFDSKVHEADKNAHVHNLSSIPLLRRFTGPVQTRQIINRIDPDVVHAFYVPSYGFYGALSGFHPLIVSAWGSDIATSEGSSITAWPDKYGGIMEPVIKYTLQQADIVHTVADHLTNRCIELGADPENVIMFPRTPDPDRFGFDVEPAIEDEDVVISARPFGPLYSLETLVKAIPKVVEEVPDATFAFLNRDTDSEEFRKLVESHNAIGNVRLEGVVPYSEMPSWFAASDVYVSTAPSDAGHVSLLESMLSGCFPIVPDIQANRAWVDDGKNGLLYPARNSDILARQIVKALKNDGWRKSIKEENRDLVLNHPRKESMKKLDQKIRSLVNKKK